MYLGCFTQHIVNQNFCWTIFIFGQLVLLHRCRQVHTSDTSAFCQQHLIDDESETERLLKAIVHQHDFCPWSEECNGTCNGMCTGRLRSIKGYCTAESFSAQDTCMEGRCLCTDPKLTCFRQQNCPCYTDDTNDVISNEECCIHAIDCIMGSGKNTESKSCFIRPDDPDQRVHCSDLATICKVLEDYICDNSCMTTSPLITTAVPTRRSNFTNFTNNDDDNGMPQSSGHTSLVYYIIIPLAILVLLCTVIVIVHYVKKKKTDIPEPEEKVDDDIDRYTTVDHPQRTECPTDTLDSNLDNPMYDMQVVGHPTLDTNAASRPTDLNDNTNSYENLSPTGSIPSSPGCGESDQLLPSSKTSTGSSSQGKLNVPVFNALQNRSRGTRSRITFLPRTPSPQPERKLLPGMTEEYEPITVPASPKESESARSSTCDEAIPMFEIKSQSIDSGYENATLTADGKLKTKTRDSKSKSRSENPTAENGTPVYDYARVSPIERKLNISDDLEYATPDNDYIGYNRLRAGDRQIDISPGSNPYNKLDISTGTIPKEEEGGEYSSLRREASVDRSQQEQNLLPDVIKATQKPH